MKRRLKINGVIMFLAFCFPVVFPAVFLRADNGSIGWALSKIGGLALILSGQILRACARGYKSENSAGGHSLIQGGPYSMVRNPMYLGILFIGLGIILVMFRWWVAVAFICIFIWRYILLMLTEETKLSAAFPGEYDRYKERIPRLFPSLEGLMRNNIVECLPLKPGWFRKEAGSIWPVWLVVFLMEGWKDIRFGGLKWYPRDAALFLGTIIVFVFLSAYLIRRTNNLQENASNKGKNTL